MAASIRLIVVVVLLSWMILFISAKSSSSKKDKEKDSAKYGSDEEKFWATLKPSDLDNVETLHLAVPVKTEAVTHQGLETLEVGQSNVAAEQTFSKEFIKRLAATSANNIEEIIDDLDIFWQFFPQKPVRFSLGNPYWLPEKVEGQKWRASKNVLKWYANYEIDPSVCAVKFSDKKKEDYSLKTFTSASALEEGWIITHDKQCGACSSLQDLATYIKMRDLTAPVRSCTKQVGLVAIRDCLTKNVGLTTECAEAWAYDASNTKFFCTPTCIKDYGLENIILGNYNNMPDNLPDGDLRPCIECDEDISGAGFKYGAGRTRRNSGIVSSIQREKGEVSDIDHSLYFK